MRINNWPIIHVCMLLLFVACSNTNIHHVSEEDVVETLVAQTLEVYQAQLEPIVVNQPEEQGLEEGPFVEVTQQMSGAADEQDSTDFVAERERGAFRDRIIFGISGATANILASGVKRLPLWIGRTILA